MEKNNLGFERQLNSDGSKNAKYVDLLDKNLLVLVLFRQKKF